MSIQGIDLVTLVVNDHDESIAFYVDTLGFELVQDEAYAPGQRWVEVAPPASDAAIALKTPEMFEEPERAHHQALIGTAPTVTFRVEDCRALYDRLANNGVTLDGPPSEESWGVSVTARDPAGNPDVFTETESSS